MHEIIEIHDNNRSGNQYDNINNKSRCIIVYMANRTACNYTVNKSRQKHGIDVKEISNSQLSGYIFINKNLAPQKFRLYMQARKLCTTKGWKTAFTNFGVIFVKKSHDVEPIIISTWSDLESIS